MGRVLGSAELDRISVAANEVLGTPPAWFDSGGDRVVVANSRRVVSGFSIAEGISQLMAEGTFEVDSVRDVMRNYWLDQVGDLSNHHPFRVAMVRARLAVGSEAIAGEIHALSAGVKNCQIFEPYRDLIHALLDEGVSVHSLWSRVPDSFEMVDLDRAWLGVFNGSESDFWRAQVAGYALNVDESWRGYYDSLLAWQKVVADPSQWADLSLKKSPVFSTEIERLNRERITPVVENFYNEVAAICEEQKMVPVMTAPDLSLNVGTPGLGVVL